MLPCGTDKRRTNDEQTNEQTREDRATQPLDAGRLRWKMFCKLFFTQCCPAVRWDHSATEWGTFASGFFIHQLYNNHISSTRLEFVFLIHCIFRQVTMLQSIATLNIQLNCISDTLKELENVLDRIHCIIRHTITIRQQIQCCKIEWKYQKICCRVSLYWTYHPLMGGQTCGATQRQKQAEKRKRRETGINLWKTKIIDFYLLFFRGKPTDLIHCIALSMINWEVSRTL